MSRSRLCTALTLLLVVAYVLVFLTYLINTPAIVAGLSVPLLYSIIVWIVILALIVTLAKVCWR